MIARSNHTTARSLAGEVRLGLALLLTVAACAGTETGGSSTTTPVTTTTTTAPLGSTLPDTTAMGCAETSGFVDAGRVMRMDQPSSDTSTLGLITWQAVDGCERFTVRFETPEGAPATTPPAIQIEFLESRQVLRVWSDAAATVVTDQLVETPLVDRLFVVRSLDGRMFIDFHLKEPAQAGAVVSTSPARLTVDLEAGIEPFETMAIIAANSVVTSPDPGEEITAGAGVEVTGYARVFEANVLVSATIGSQVVAESATTAADWSETWGQFNTTIRLPPGEVTLFVGEESAEDESPIGSTLSLTVR